MCFCVLIPRPKKTARTPHVIREDRRYNIELPSSLRKLINGAAGWRAEIGECNSMVGTFDVLGSHGMVCRGVEGGGRRRAPR